MTSTDRPVDHDFTAIGPELDPYYQQLQRERPVARIRLRNGQLAWLVTRWEDARRVLADPLFSRALAAGRAAGPLRRETFITDMDPPEHTRVRRHALTAFTHRRVQRMRPGIEQIVTRLLDEMEADGDPADLVEYLSLPLPVTVICELLGVPAQDRDRFGSWSDAFLSVSAYTPEEVAAAHQRLDSYLAGLIAQRRAEPEDDLLSALVHVRDDEGGLTEGELVNLGVGLLIAGYETTATQLTNFTYTLLTHPGAWERLLAEPDLLPAAIEELLRFVPLGSETGMPRVATQDVLIGGVLIHAGEMVLAARPVANRDESVFPHSQRLDLDRSDNPHLAFGYGIHHCLGAHLARLELQTAIGALLTRYPRLHLAVPTQELRWKEGLSVRGLVELPIAWRES